MTKTRVDEVYDYFGFVALFCIRRELSSIKDLKQFGDRVSDTVSRDVDL